MRSFIRTITAVALIAILFTGCKADKNTAAPTQETQPEKTEKLIQLVLPEDYEAYPKLAAKDGFYGLYSNGYSGIRIIQNKNMQNTTLEEFVNQESAYYQLDAEQKDGFWFLIYEDLSANEPQTYVRVYYKNADMIWVVESYCPSQNYGEYEAQLWQYLTSANFSEN